MLVYLKIYKDMPLMPLLESPSEKSQWQSPVKRPVKRAVGKEKSQWFSILAYTRKILIYAKIIFVYTSIYKYIPV